MTLIHEQTFINDCVHLFKCMIDAKIKAGEYPWSEWIVTGGFPNTVLFEDSGRIISVEFLEPDSTNRLRGGVDVIPECVGVFGIWDNVEQGDAEINNMASALFYFLHKEFYTFKFPVKYRGQDYADVNLADQGFRLKSINGPTPYTQDGQVFYHREILIHYKLCKMEV